MAGPAAIKTDAFFNPGPGGIERLMQHGFLHGLQFMLISPVRVLAYNPKNTWHKITTPIKSNDRNLLINSS